MKPDNEAPEILFAWLEQKDYHELSQEEKNTVLAYFAQEEYENMREAAREFRTGKYEIRKNAVMGAYDRQYGGKVRRLPVPFGWRLAAAIMPVGLIALIFFLKQGNNELGVTTAQTADTIYVNTETVGPKEFIHDTVFLIRYQEQKNYNPAPSNHVTFQQAKSQNSEDLQGLSIDELFALPDSREKNSMEYDSLWKEFEPVTL